MIQTIIFSKSRACQLDLLLRSLSRAPGVFNRVSVIYKCTHQDYNRAYQLCQRQHPGVDFIPELGVKKQDFQNLVFERLAVGESEYVSFLCDDDIVTRPFIDSPHPERILKDTKEILCVSMRLGQNTTSCYPLYRAQDTPKWLLALNDTRVWDWTHADGDWGYPGSLDGHIFNRNLLRAILSDAKFTNPNELEDQLSQACSKLKRTFPLMACYGTSVVTGVPVNLVNTTHGNRHSETHPTKVEELNVNYLKGKRLNLGEIRRGEIQAAHTELKLVFA